METNNFDNQIKEQLEQRTMEPSAKSWEQLRSKLDHKDKKTIPIYVWLRVAASLVAGFLIVNLVFISSNETNLPMLVNETHNTPKDDFLQNPNPINEITLTEVSEEQEIQVTSSGTKIHYPKSTTSVEENSIVESLPKEKKHDTHILSEENFLPKLNEIIAIATAENTEKNKTEDEVDALLRDAAEQLYLENKYSERLSEIHAKSLLQSVESELNQTFREKIIDILKEGLLITKNAVAIKTN
jgi:hypothetical protein